MSVNLHTAWAEETGLNPGAGQPTGTTALTVSTMLRTHYMGAAWLLGLPLLAGVITALFGVHTMMRFSVEPGTVARVMEYRSTAMSVVGLALMALMFLTVRRTAVMILGMGVSRRAYWNGIAHASLVTAVKLTLVLAMLIGVEAATFGWGLLWGVYSSSFIPALVVAYTWKMNAFTLAVSVASWFLWVLLAQLVGAFLAVVAYRLKNLRWGLIYFLGVVALVLLAIGTWVNGGFALDLGFSGYIDMQPMYWDSEGHPIYLSHTLYPEGTFPPLVSSFYPPGYIYMLVDYAVAPLAGYVMGWLVFRRTSLR